MTTLLTFRDNIKAFFSRYDYILTPIFKFVLALLLFWSLNKQMGYMSLLQNILLLVLLATICAFLPVEFMAGIGGIMIILHSSQVALDAALVGLALLLIFYFGYMRFAPKTGLIVLLVPLCYICNVVYALPIVLGFLVGPAAIIPAMFGIILYYYGTGLGELANLLAAATEEEEAVQGYQYILTALLGNKLMVLMFVVFACVILVTYAIYRSSFSNSWIVAFLTGGFLNVVLFLVGGVTMMIEVEIAPIFVGSIVGVLIAVVCQFGKGIVDYQRTELLQFEDDEYYYYVKAIPKLSVAESNKNIKRINSKTHN